MLRRIFDLLDDEEGDAILLSMPFFIVMGVVMFVFVANYMTWNSERNSLQVMADAASRAGTVAIGKSEAVWERNNSGAYAYHVYTELDSSEACDLAQDVISTYASHLKLSRVSDCGFNEMLEGKTYPVWNSRTFRYDERGLTTKEQYKNGSFSVRLKGRIKSLWPGLIKVKDELEVNLYSQSKANGKVN